MSNLDHELAEALIQLIVAYQESTIHVNSDISIAQAAAQVFRRAGTPDSIKLLVLYMMVTKFEDSSTKAASEVLA